MSLSRKIILIFLIVINYFYFVTCTPTVVSCTSNDSNCLKKLLENVHATMNQDPFELRDIAINIPDTIEFNITEGLLHGLNSCAYIDAKIELENGSGFVIVQCNLTSRGIYNAVIWKPKTIGVNVNRSLNCDGPFEISFLNIRMKYNIKFSITKSDGEFYLQFDDGDVEYNVNNEGHKVVYALAGVFSGTEDVTVTFNKAINKHWRPASAIVVGHIIKSVIGSIAEPKLQYFSKTPVSKFLTDDIQNVALEANDKDKCSIKNTNCQLELLKNIKELTISKDVLVLKNLTVKLPDLMDFTLLEGSINGVDKCTIKSAKFDFDLKRFILEQYCDLVIKGTYVAYLYANATLTTFGGQNVDAHGNTEVNLVKLPLNAEYEFSLVKTENGDIFIKFKETKINYDYNEPGHSISFKLDGVQLGSLDISEIAMNILNDNWQFFAPDFGPTFILAITRLINDPLLVYLTNKPTKNYFVESLDIYV